MERFARDLAAVTSIEELGRRLAGIFRELGLVTREEWEELELRVAQLEHRVRLLEEPALRTAGEASRLGRTPADSDTSSKASSRASGR